MSPEGFRYPEALFYLIPPQNTFTNRLATPGLPDPNGARQGKWKCGRRIYPLWRARTRQRRRASGAQAPIGGAALPAITRYA